MFNSFMPDWKQTWTAAQAEKELTFKFKGPGIYQHAGKTMIAVPADRKPTGSPVNIETFWAQEFTASDEKFVFCVYDGRDPADMFDLIINAPTREDDRNFDVEENPKVVTTPQLLAVNANSEKHGYNRLLPASVIDKLDPNGFHVVKVHFVHGDVQCFRCLVHTKIKDHEEPVEGPLDINIEEYNKLPDYKAVKKALENQGTHKG
jgi:hypothetical protein